MLRTLLTSLLLIFTSTSLSASPACPAYDRKAGMGSRIMEILLPMM